MKRIDKVAVLGTGVMGGAIAAHLANAGIDVLLLDVVPEGSGPSDSAESTKDARCARNRVAQSALDRLLTQMPAPLFLPEYQRFISVGNFEDDATKLNECDWIVEAVVENLAIKQRLFRDTVVPNMKEGAVLSSNTSGLQVESMAQILPDAVRKNFLVTHFFNPPRYMRLMEIVSCSATDPEVCSFMKDFTERRLGKGVVFAKDTPNFVANRIGTYAGANASKHMLEMGLSVEEVDAVTGFALARPKTATFALWDLVGIDTVVRVTSNSFELLVNDDERGIFAVPEFVMKMVQNGLLGKKSGKGFYKKETIDGTSVRFFYDYKSRGYLPSASPSYPSAVLAKQIDQPEKRILALLSGKDLGAEFAWKTLRDTLIYTAKRLPEIAEDVVSVDNAMKWGYNWELGPFEIFDAIGVSSFVTRAEGDGCTIPAWVKKVERFYLDKGGKRYYYSIPDGEYREIAIPGGRIGLNFLKGAGAVIEQNSSASLLDLKDGVFCLEFHSKLNTIGADTLSMVAKAIKRTEEEGVGLVIGNEGSLFSAGANLMLLAMAIAEGDFDEIARMVKSFQKAMMAIKYARVPVVAAPHQLVMGGGCEICLHADAIVAHAETYMGLVEIGVGILPAGGGTKEMALRAIRLASQNGADVTPFLIKNYQNIALAKVSRCADELFDMGYMHHGDTVCMNPDDRIHRAKSRVLDLAASYRPALPAIDLKAPGRSVAASIKAQLWNLVEGRRISEHDAYLAGGIAEVITGGDVPGGMPITEEYLLELEREAFLRFCGQKKSLERIQHMLKKGKALRN